MGRRRLRLPLLRRSGRDHTRGSFRRHVCRCRRQVRDVEVCAGTDHLRGSTRASTLQRAPSKLRPARPPGRLVCLHWWMCTLRGSTAQRSRATTCRWTARTQHRTRHRATRGVIGSQWPRLKIQVRRLHLLARCADRKSAEFERNMRIDQPPGDHPVVALMRAGMVACTPGVPVVAISVGTLDLYYRLRRHAPRLGVQPFVRALCDRYMVCLSLRFADSI